MMQTNWYEHFFSGVALDFWRNAVTYAMPPGQTRGDADFLESVLKLPAGGRVLDCPCGNGRHSLDLAARGYRTTGIDLAAEFIAEAKGAAAGAGLEAEFLERDMRGIDAAGEFDGAFCFGNSFGYLGYQGDGAFLTAVSRALKRGGRFALDTGLVAESLLPKLENRRWMQLGDILYLSVNRYEAAESRLDTQYTFIREGRRETRDASYSIYTLAELRRMLSAAGLLATEYYGGFDRRPYEMGSQRLLLVAEKE
jgi:SAM-dependent methyltransferase